MRAARSWRFRAPADTQRLGRALACAAVIIAAAYPGVSSTAVLPVGGKVTLLYRGLSRGSDVTNGGVAATGHGLRCAYGQGSVQGLPDAEGLGNPDPPRHCGKGRVVR
jgi:hypothetical protein